MSVSPKAVVPLSERVLRALAAHPDGLTLLDLMPLTEASSRVQCSNAIRSMKRAGYVQPGDVARKRGIAWRITPAGRVRLDQGKFRAPRGSFTHGTDAGYNQYKCHCSACRAWQHDDYQAWRRENPEKAVYDPERARRWRRENPDKEAAHRARGHAATRRKNNALREVASRHGQPWTGTDLEMASRTDMTAEQVAKVLGRSLRSVMDMRDKLRDRNPRDRMLRDGTPPTSRSGPR